MHTHAKLSKISQTSVTLSSWANLCNKWTGETGVCPRGVDCNYQHPGIKMEDGRCFTCKSKEHKSAQCTASGGGADPKKKTAWRNYRAREQAFHNGGKGKGKGKSKSKKGNGKDTKGKDKTRTFACIHGQVRQTTI